MFLRTVKNLCRQVGIILAVLLMPLSALAQSTAVGSVAGVIVSTWNAAPLAGVTVTVRGTTLATQADANGRFELKGVPTGDQVLRFSKSGYASATVTEVRVLPDQTTTVNGNLRPEFYDLEEYEVTAEEFNSQSEKIMFEREKSSGLMDAIGSEQFSKLGATDAAAALGKVTGASVADGKFAVVRGLPDRYTSTTMNGGDIPSADPNRRAVQLDLFPSQFIDQLNVRKTFLPDMPGGFSGGAIDIVTKAFPEKPMFNFSVGGAYNTQASLRDDFLMSDHGDTDWIAKDDGKRRLPGSVARTSPLGTSGQLDPTIKNSFGSSQFAPIAGSSPLNSSYSLAVGDTKTIFGHRVGLLGGLYYKQDYNHYSDGTVSKFIPGAGSTDVKNDVRSVINYTWGAMVGVGLELAEEHQVSFNYFTVATAEDEARHLQGQDSSAGTVPGESYLDQSILHWTERTLNTYQVKGTHVFKELGNLGFDWVGSVANTTQDEPDHRIFQFIAQPGNPDDPSDDFNLANGATKPSRPTRIWRNLTENNIFFRGDLKYPLPSYTSKDNYLKVGGFVSDSKREYISRALDVRQNSFNHPFVVNGDPNTYLSEENLNYIEYYNFPGSYVYSGKQTINGYYLMGDWSVLEWLQLVGGARFEQTELLVVSQNLGRNLPPTTSQINQSDILPGLSMVLSLRTNLLVKGSWSETVVRPTYREISDAETYDTGAGRTYLGNPNLKMSSSQNFDLRLEWFPRPGELISISYFKKIIMDPIEQASQNRENDFIYYNNFERADVQGIEFELRKSMENMPRLIRDFSIGFNFTYIMSEVPLTQTQYDFRTGEGLKTDKTRPMFDQPEYILNADITWDHKSSGTAFTVSGGIVGRRLVVTGLATPDEYEEPAPQLDVFVSQSLGKHCKLKFSAKNLLDPVYETTQNWDFLPGYGTSQTVKVRSYTKGITLGISLSYDY